jgi:hypothetical protein
MGRGPLSPESAARQKKLIAETRAKNNAVKAEAMKALAEKKQAAAFASELAKRAKTKSAGASRPVSTKPRKIAGSGGGPRGGGMRGGMGFGGGSGLRGNVNK